ncbi:hypothetical protein [Massilia suwonensis]|uniref:Lipocalin-like domain-containing protein n=1 Tax=Massilia suwonensis TaxID=648895 RepID=A0ABW0MIB3_9BURK
MKRLLLIAAVLPVLSSCGGGEGESGTSTAPVSTAPVAPLAAYLGNWATSCHFHAIDYASISHAPGTTDSISITYKTDYHVNPDCSGAVLGTWTQSASATAVYEGSVDSSIVFIGGSAAVAARVDKVTTSLPSHTWSVTGTGVEHSVVDGLAQWCITYANGDRSCIMDEGTYRAFVVNPTGLYLQGNVMYELRSNVSFYMENKAFKRQ